MGRTSSSLSLCGVTNSSRRRGVRLPVHASITKTYCTLFFIRHIHFPVQVATFFIYPRPPSGQKTGVTGVIPASSPVYTRLRFVSRIRRVRHSRRPLTLIESSPCSYFHFRGRFFSSSDPKSWNLFSASCGLC